MVTMLNGKVVLDGVARKGETVASICRIADLEVLDGFADRADVIVDGKLHKTFTKDAYEEP